MKKGFTLIELLVVVAIIAVIGAGVAVTYGRQVVDEARQQMTIHEMGQIRDAFQRFYADNSDQLLNGLTVADSATVLPTADFAFLAASDNQTYKGYSSTRPQRIYGMFEFFERYGLWPLFQKSVGDLAGGAREVQIFDTTIDAGKYEFADPSPAAGTGWHGPYLSSSERVDCVPHATDTYILEATIYNKNESQYKRLSDDSVVSDGEVRFPQPATKYNDSDGGFYRIVYFEHCPYESAGQPIYRRLLLIASEQPSNLNTEQSIARFRGNRRYSGSDAVLPIEVTTGAVKSYDSSTGVFFMELLNFDTVYR